MKDYVLIIICVKHYRYTPPLMKKVIGDYLSLIPLYKEAMFEMWDLKLKVTSWAIRILKKLDLIWSSIS
jgi:hypothetical protein